MIGQNLSNHLMALLKKGRKNRSFQSQAPRYGVFRYGNLNL
jgi:hypothetical protein